MNRLHRAISGIDLSSLLCAVVVACSISSCGSEKTVNDAEKVPTAKIVNTATAEAPAAKTGNTVTVEPPVVKIEKAKQKHAGGKDAAASDHETARTDWLFSIKPELDFDVKKEKKEEDGYHIWIEITGVKQVLGLPITTTVSADAPKYVLDHEQWHVKICTRIYEKCRQFALDAGKNVIGKRFEGFGADRALALNNAWQFAAQDLTSPYRAKASAWADDVSSNYDQLCEKEERRALVDKTVDDAFVRASKEKKKLKP